MKTLPWILAAIASLVAAGLWMRGPVAVTKEVPVEVEKQVIKEVEKKFSPEEAIAIKQYSDLTNAQAINKYSDLLKGIRRIKVIVSLDKELSAKWSSSGIEDKLTLELRKGGFEVLSTGADAQATVVFRASGLENTNSGLMFYVAGIDVSHALTALTWDMKYHKWLGVIWTTQTFGYFGGDKATESQRNAVESVTNTFVSDLLEANPLTRN